MVEIVKVCRVHVIRFNRCVWTVYKRNTIGLNLFFSLWDPQTNPLLRTLDECNHIWTYLTTCHFEKRQSFSPLIPACFCEVSSCCWCWRLPLTFMGSRSHLNDWMPAFAVLNCVVSIRERVRVPPDSGSRWTSRREEQHVVHPHKTEKIWEVLSSLWHRN